MFQVHTAPPGFSPYQPIQELASGGMGSVELARVLAGPQAGRLVALKRLHAHLEKQDQFAEMFFDEARLTAGLRHPNVVELVDFGVDGKGKFLALEYIPGDSVLALLKESKRARAPISVGLACYLVACTAEGLHAAHELRDEAGELKHLVHRDVTPSNILVALDGTVKLIDFGVAKARDKLSHTTTGTIKGKFGYMSPEQARGFPLDRRSDLFALGIVLWELLAQRRLYRSESELEILRMIVDDPPPSVRAVRPEVPEELDALLQCVLAKNRDHRLRTCGELAQTLRQMAQRHGWREGRAELAAYFQAVLPERYAALRALLSGAASRLESSSSPPGSGSFPSAPAQSGVAALPPTMVSASPLTTISSSNVAAVAQSPGVASRPSNGLVLGVAAVSVLIALASVGALLLRGSRPAPPPPTVVLLPPPPVVPAAPVAAPPPAPPPPTAAPPVALRQPPSPAPASSGQGVRRNPRAPAPPQGVAVAPPPPPPPPPSVPAPAPAPAPNTRRGLQLNNTW